MELGYRDYLVDINKLPNDIMSCEGQYWLHGYLENTDLKQKIVKIKRAGEQQSAWVTTKWRDSDPEEKTMPYEDAMEILERTPFLPIIEKDILEMQDRLWRLAFYHGDLEGLVISTYRVIRARSHQKAITTLPPWVTRDITDDTYYREWNLAKLMKQAFKVPENWWVF